MYKLNWQYMWGIATRWNWPTLDSREITSINVGGKYVINLWNNDAVWEYAIYKSTNGKFKTHTTGSAGSNDGMSIDRNSGTPINHCLEKAKKVAMDVVRGELKKEIAEVKKVLAEITPKKTTPKKK